MPDESPANPKSQSESQPRPNALAGREWLIVWAVVFAAFSPCLTARFVNWDDPAFLLENPVIHSLAPRNLISIFTSFHADYYAPLVFLSYALEHAAWGFNPAGYHAVNVALHCLAACLALRLLKTLGVSHGLALWLSVIWAVHPMKVESVAWVTERKDVLCGVFAVAAMVLYIQYLRCGNRSRYAASLAASVAAMMCKGMALTIPLILFVLDAIEGVRQERRRLAEKAPFFIAAALFGATTFIAQRGGEVTSASQILDLRRNVLVAAFSLWFHLGKFVFPDRLSAIYPLPEPVSLHNTIYAASLASTFIAAIVLLRLSRRFPNAALGAAWFYAAFLPVSQWIPLRIPLADRYLYLPSLAMVWTAGAAANRLAGRPKAMRLARNLAAAVALCLAMLAFSRCMVWRDSSTLWNDVLAKFPGRWEAHLNLGHYYANRPNPDPIAAAAHYEAALRGNPASENAAYNLGNLKMRAGHYDEAAALFEKVIEIRPARRDAALNLAFCRVQQRRFDEALAIYDRLILENPRWAAPLASRGAVLFYCGRLDEARRDCLRALEIDPRCPEAQETLQRIEAASRNQ